VHTTVTFGTFSTKRLQPLRKWLSNLFRIWFVDYYGGWHVLFVLQRHALHSVSLCGIAHALSATTFASTALPAVATTSAFSAFSAVAASATVAASSTALLSATLATASHIHPLHDHRCGRCLLLRRGIVQDKSGQRA